MTKKPETEPETPPVELTEEQQAYVQKMILADRAREHRAIAGDQAYRLAYFYVMQDCQRGLYDMALANVLAEEWEQFKIRNPIIGIPPQPKAPEKKE